MKKGRLILYICWLAAAGCLYFFENNAGTRAALLCVLLLSLIPFFRRLLFAPDRPAARRGLTEGVRSSVVREEEDDGDVRPYRPGDPVRKIHWKLSAKRDEPLVRTDRFPELPREERAPDADAGAGGPGRDRPRDQKRKLLLLPAAAGVISLLLLFLIPAARDGLGALLNRLYARSEAVNPYVYERFPVPDGQPVWPAAALVWMILLSLVWITAVLGSRGLGLLLYAAAAGGQMYFGLSLPIWANGLLFALTALWMMRRPLRLRDGLSLTALALTVFLAMSLLWPGADPSTEAASERARDWLSRAARQDAGFSQELPQAEEEARHVHNRTLVTGDGTAAPDRAFRLVPVEEKQISMPRWTDWLRIAMLLLLSAAALVLPFLPFLWVNARRKAALEKRQAFDSGDVSTAVQAVFRQVIAWLEAMGEGAGNIPFRDWADVLSARMPDDYLALFRRCAARFEEAAYSTHVLPEEAREEALALLQRTEDLMKPRADRKQRFRLRYRECLWI